MVVMVSVLVGLVMVMFMLVVVMFMFFIMMVLVLLVVVVAVAVGFPFFFGSGLTFYLAYPSGRSSHAFEVEHTGVEDAVKVDASVVAFDDFGSRLQGLDDLLDASQFFGFHFRSLVQQDDVAEFDLLDDKVFDILLVDVLARQVVAAGKLALHAQGVDYGNDAVQPADAVSGIHAAHRRYGADGLGNRLGLADAACFDDDVVEALHLQYVAYLFYQVHLQRTADAAVLQGYQAVVLLAYNAAFLDEVGVDIYFADVVDDDGKLDAAFVGQNLVDQCGLSTAQITGEQQYRNFFCIHEDCYF